ncbi:radial spoke head 14 homolog [Hetaerina americana]|uniref:radial spoke head 14 homolog n=1 Tax=Hetaerina americana TaxID=62018 RepID=UPI003A7F32AE
MQDYGNTICFSRKISKPQDLEPPFLPLLRNEPNIFTPNNDITRAEIAYGRWALPQLLKGLHAENIERCLIAIDSLSNLFHDPEKLYEAVELKILDRIHELLKSAKAIIREAALIALGIACNHYVGSDAVIFAEAQSRWDPENLFESFNVRDGTTSEDEMDLTASYVKPVDLGRLAIILSDNYASVRYKAANVVNNISKSWLGPEGLHENNFIPVLLERAAFEGFQEIQTEVLDALHGCLQYDQLKALKLGGMALLSKLLQNNDSKVRISSANCIAALAMHPVGKIQAIELDLLPLLIPLLFSEDVDELASAAGCISFITMTTPSKIRAVQLKIVDRLVFLAGYRISLKLQLNAVKALTNISEATKGRALLLNSYVERIEAIPCDHDETLRRAIQILIKVIRWLP